jgi:hypothetical protein
MVRVERRAVIGAGRLKPALRGSEDSGKLNTLVCRTAKSDDAARRSVSQPPNAMSGRWKQGFLMNPRTRLLLPSCFSKVLEQPYVKVLSKAQ